MGKGLTDIKYRTLTRLFINYLQPLADIGKKDISSSHNLHLPVIRFDIKHWSKVAFIELALLQELPSLLISRRCCREEMIGAHTDSFAPSHSIVVIIIAVEYRAAFRRLNIYKGYRIIDLTLHFFFRVTAKTCYPQFAPVDGVFLAVMLVLMAREVNSIYSIGVVSQPFPFEHIILPCPSLQVIVWRDIESEAVPLAILPVAFIVGAIGVIHLA